MVVGIPNVGKSSLINKLAGPNGAKVEDRPGVTRGRQWVKISNELELLDMPGVLWPKFEDQTVGEHLAFTGAVKDDVIDIELLAMRLLQLLNRDYPQLLQERYKVEAAEDTEAYELLTMVGRKRGMLISGGEVNTERAAITVLDEYRSGKLGRISLESLRKPNKNGFRKRRNISQMNLFEYDESLNIDKLCGIDEAGRGPLAGPVFCGGGYFAKGIGNRRIERQ